jgi:hypothetical protein
VVTLFNLRSAGVRIATLVEGEVSELQAGLKGTKNALPRKDLAAKTHHELRKRVEEGAGGGLCLLSRRQEAGFRWCAGPGRHESVEEEATIVRRISFEFASGKSPTP